ncbi:MAG: ABC-2 transporter permease [Firmicutes bacterium]|nr:ABC-2 transporter permease [Bacillota bacterium]
MKNLLYKELTFSINQFFFIIPFVLAVLFFIPNWLYSLVIMYFFWISVPQIIGGYTAQLDYKFCSILPVAKKDIVNSKVIAFLILELIHIIAAAIFGIIHNLIYGSWNLFMEINPAYFGVMLVMLALFNIILLPSYFKTAYKFGKPIIIGVFATLLFAGIFEVGAAIIPFMSSILKSTNVLIQLTVLFSGIVLFAVINYITLKRSISNFERIK